MAYATDANIRKLSGNPSTDEVPTATVTQFISWSDSEVDRLLGGNALFFSFKKRIQDNDDFVIVSTSAISEITEVFIDGKKFSEFQINVLENPEIENGTSGVVDDWSETTASNTTYTWDTATVFKGHRSLKIEKTGADATSSFYSDAMTVQYSKMYRAEAYIKTDADITGNVKLRIAWYDSDGSLIENDDSSNISTEQGWTKTTIDAVAPYNANTAKIFFMHTGTDGSAWADKLKFRKRNWKGDTTNYAVDFNQKLRNNSLLLVKFKLSTASTDITHLANILGAIQCLFYVNGIESSGTNYVALKSEVASAGQPQFQRLALSLLNDADQILSQLLNYSSDEAIDFFAGKFKRNGYFDRQPPSRR